MFAYGKMPIKNQFENMKTKCRADQIGEIVDSIRINLHPNIAMKINETTKSNGRKYVRSSQFRGQFFLRSIQFHRLSRKNAVFFWKSKVKT